MTSDDIINGDLYKKKKDGLSMKLPLTLLKLNQMKPLKNIHKNRKFERAKTLGNCVVKLAGDQKNSESYKELIKLFLLQNIQTLQELCEKEPRLCTQLKKLSPRETLDFLRALGLRANDHKRIITMLNKLQMNYLASSPAVLKEKKKLLQKIEYESGFMTCYKNSQQKETMQASYARVKDLEGLVNSMFEEFKEKQEELLEINGRHVVLLSGDKGGNAATKSNYMKFAFNIITKDKPQDFSSFAVYAMTTAPDNYENMKSFHSCYYEQIRNIMENKSPLGKDVICILGGDFNHLSMMLGHQGSMSTYPSMFTKVENTHLQQYHKINITIPHNHSNPECNADFRTKDELLEDYMEASANNPSEMRKRGKESHSIIGPPLLPLKFELEEHIAIPALHIVSGGFCYMEKKFITECSNLDQQTPVQQESLENIKLNMDRLQDELNNLFEKQTEYSSNWIDNKDNLDLLETGNINNKEPCDAQVCILKIHENILWIACDNPNHPVTGNSFLVILTKIYIYLHFFEGKD